MRGELDVREMETQETIMVRKQGGSEKPGSMGRCGAQSLSSGLLSYILLSLHELTKVCMCR